MTARPNRSVSFDGPFTSQQAHARGLTPNALTKLIAQGEIVRLRRGVYAPARSVTPHDLIMAALLTAPDGAVLGFEAAATLLGVPIPHSRGLTRVDLYVAPGTPPGGGRPLPEVRLHYVTLPSEQILQFGGQAVTSLSRTAVDISRGQPLERALIPLDHARRNGVRLRELYDARYAAAGNRGIAILDTALRHCSGLAESPFESMSRGIFIAAALPAPVLQQSLTGADGGLYRVDFFWPEYGLIGEADGMSKYAEDPAAFRREKWREDDLRLSGYGFVRWTWHELVCSPEIVTRRIEQAMRNRRRLRSSSDEAFKR